MVIPAVIDPRVVLLALPPGDSDPTGGHGPEWGKAAPIGLLILLLLGVALFLLIKSMNRNLRKVPLSFDNEATEGTDGTGRDGRPAEGAGGEGPVGDGGDGEPPEGGDGNPGDAARGGTGDGDLADGDTRATASS